MDSKAPTAVVKHPTASKRHSVFGTEASSLGLGFSEPPLFLHSPKGRKPRKVLEIKAPERLPVWDTPTPDPEKVPKKGRKVKKKSENQQFS